MRVVFDTNVLISAYIFAGICKMVIDHCIDNHEIEIVLSKTIVNEFNRVLIDKFRYSDGDASVTIETIALASEIVEPVTFDKQICRDPDDDAILGTAVAGNANCIVTGDSDLLVLEGFQGVDIVSPSEFARYESESQSL